MTAFSRHSISRSLEGVGNLVEVVTVMNANKLEQRGGLTDFGWKQKQRNTLSTITKREDFNNTLTFILEEQYALIKMYAGNLESILLNVYVEDTTATFTVNNSLTLLISSDTINRSVSLINYFSGVYNKYGWDRCKLQLKIHADRLGLI